MTHNTTAPTGKRGDMAVDEKLKPCPFCAGEAHVHHNADPESGNGYYYAVCKSFKCCWGPDGVTEADAATLWNTRQHESAKPDSTSGGDGWCVDCRFPISDCFTRCLQCEQQPLPASRAASVQGDGQSASTSDELADCVILAWENQEQTVPIYVAYHLALAYRHALSRERAVWAEAMTSEGRFFRHGRWWVPEQQSPSLTTEQQKKLREVAKRLGELVRYVQQQAAENNLCWGLLAENRVLVNALDAAAILDTLIQQPTE